MILIVDSEICNTGSILNMLKRLGHVAVASGDPEAIRSADKLILPGVGSFGAGMSSLVARGFIEPLRRRVLEDKTPVLGICLGMQILTRQSEEGGPGGLGWIAGETVKFDGAAIGPDGKALRVPHMGWNQLEPRRSDPLLADLAPDARFYFVHSYHVRLDDPADVLATATYGEPFTAALQRDNIWGVQFHPEKSHRYGMAVLRAFAERCV